MLTTNPEVTPPRPPGLLAIAAASGVALVLAWLVLSNTLVAFLAETRPHLALWLRSNDPTALVAVADELVRKHAKPGKSATGETVDPHPEREADLARARANALKALTVHPLNPPALRLLGELASVDGDKASATRLMAAALERSNRETSALLWLMVQSYETRDFVSAVAHADLLLRTRSQTMPVVAPLLGWVADQEAGWEALKPALLANPPWREELLNVLPKYVGDARTPLKALLALKASAHPPTDASLRGYLRFLVDQRQYETAYYTWLEFLPREQLARVGFLFNGDFKSRPSGLPFDWVIEHGAGVTVDIAPAADHGGQKALHIQFGEGRVELGGVHQLTMLGPGSYLLRGRVKGTLIARRGLEWRISCADRASEPIARSQPMSGTVASWTAFEVKFTVPAQDCRAQKVHLTLNARSASERIVTGAVWYDGLSLVRAP